jgi:N utilization substance protein B
MGARRIGREKALQALYHLEVGGARPEDALKNVWSMETEAPADPEIQRFASQLVHGVWEHREEIDALIGAHSHNWRLDRMSRIDRNILRLGTYELKHCADIPKKVSINEAVELGKLFGNQDSSAFINGLLDRVATSLGKT